VATNVEVTDGEGGGGAASEDTGDFSLGLEGAAISDNVGLGRKIFSKAAGLETDA
jgi:hypothetical protein